MEGLRVKLGYGDETRCKEKVHVVAVPYPAQGHIMPLMQLCKKLASEEGVMVTFVNTMHNHARILQAEQAAAGTMKAQYAHNFNIIEKYTTTTCSHSNSNLNSNVNNNKTISSNTTLATSTINNTEMNTKSSNSGPNSITNYSTFKNSNSTHGNLTDNCKDNNNIRLVGIPGGLPPELHGDPAQLVATFQASEALCGPLEKLLEKLNQEGPPVSCIISDVLMSWTQECADKLGIPRFAFWTSSAAVYHVIWHMYGLISQGIPTFKAANTIFENNNTEMVSCIPGLPPMDLNDLPIIVRSDPADFIYQFLTRQLKPMERAAAVLLNTFYQLEEHCLQALPATSPVPIYSIGPLLPLHVILQDNVDGESVGVDNSVEPAEAYMKTSVFEIIEKYQHAADRLQDCKAAAASSGGNVSSGVTSDGRSVKAVKTDTISAVKVAEKAVTASRSASEKACKNAVEIMEKNKHAADREDCKGAAASSDGTDDGGNGKFKSGVKSDGGSVGAVKVVKIDTIMAGKVDEKAVKAAEKAVWASEKAVKGSRKAVARRSSAGIFSEDVSCLEWLDRKAAGSVLYISFGSIFAMTVDQFTELTEGLQASKQAFLWSIRPGFVQGTSNYTHSLPPSFLHATQHTGMLVSWVPQLTVLAHPAIAGFLTHCGWNSTLESVALGVPMLCWPDVGERRTNGRLAVSLWQAGLEFSCSLHKNGLLISREEVKRVILLLMDPCSTTAAQLRSKAASLQVSARLALSHSGSSSHDWNLFLQQIQHPMNC